MYLDFSANYSKSSGYFSTPDFFPHSSENTSFSSWKCLDRFPFPLPVTRVILPLSHSSPTALTLKYLPFLALQTHFCQPFNSLVFLHNCCHISTPRGAMTYTGTSARTDRCLWNRSPHPCKGLVVLEWTWFYEDSDCESLLKALKLKQCFPFMFWSFSFWQFKYLNQARC